MCCHPSTGSAFAFQFSSPALLTRNTPLVLFKWSICKLTSFVLLLMKSAWGASTVKYGTTVRSPFPDIQEKKVPEDTVCLEELLNGFEAKSLFGWWIIFPSLFALHSASHISLSGDGTVCSWSFYENELMWFSLIMKHCILGKCWNVLVFKV